MTALTHQEARRQYDTKHGGTNYVTELPADAKEDDCCILNVPEHTGKLCSICRFHNGQWVTIANIAKDGTILWLD